MQGRQQPKKILSVYVPADLHDIYAIACAQAGITKSAGIVHYLRYLKAQHNRKEALLHGKSDPSKFSLV